MFLNRTPKSDEPKINPDWQPPTDAVFQYLLQEAALGWVPVYFAAIPLSRLVRFAPTFKPEKTKDGESVVLSIMKEWREGKTVNMWVYPHGAMFVVSDDYFTLAAAERGNPDLVPCWVLGEVKNKSAELVQGPMEQKSIAQMLGIS